MLEEAVCGAARDHRGFPGEVTKISRGVEREGEQVERDEDAGESFFAVRTGFPLFGVMGPHA